MWLWGVLSVLVSDVDDRVDHGPGDFSLGGEVDLDRLRVGPHQSNRVGVVGEAHVGSAHVVGDDQVEVRPRHLRCRVRAQVVGFRGETDEDLPVGLRCSETGEDVGGRLEDDLGDAVTANYATVTVMAIFYL